MSLPQPPGMMRGIILARPDHEAIATEALATIDDARQIAPFSALYPGLTLVDAYRGFTNRTIWAEYAVYAPLWGFVSDTTVRDLPPPRQAAQHPFTPGPPSRATACALT